MNRPISRRMWLRGAAGFTLALPLLPSLLESDEARAGTNPNVRKRFVAMGTDHGGVWQASMYPGDSILTSKAQYAGREVRSGALALDVSGGNASLSPVLSAAATALTPALAAKMNVLRGLDVSFYLAHHRGGHLGNYAENDGNGADGPIVPRMPTIDQVLAWSPTFYGDLATIKERSLVIGGNGMSANWSQPSTKSGDIQNLSPENDSLVLFNKIFVPQEDPTKIRPPIVDRVMEDYKRLKNGNRRLSAADKQRLDDHLDRLDELQRKLAVQVSCGEIPTPTHSSTDEWQSSSFGIDPDAQKRFWQLQNDVIAAAFACDTCRIATLRVTDIFSTFAGDWHQDIAHKSALPEGSEQAVIAAAHQRFFESVFVDLMAKLDAIPEVEGTVLDNTLMQWTHEAGCVTHDPIELPVVTAGGAGGFFKTGQYADYRNLGKQAHTPSADNAVTSHTGLVYNQWLGNVLQSMGLSPAEFESGSYGGYGYVQLSTETWYAGYQQYGAAELGSMSDILPFLKA